MNENHASMFLKRFRIPLILTGAVLLVLVGYIVFRQLPFSPLHMCTLIGCSDSLELTFSNLPSQEISLQLTADTGETRSITCSPDTGDVFYTATNSAPSICHAGTVTFYDFAPQALTIEVTWQGGSFSIVGRPAYESFQPNGRDCPPVPDG